VQVAAWALAAAVLLGLGLYLRAGTLDRNDRIASVASMFVGLLSLVIAALGLRAQLRQGSSTVDDVTRLDQAADS
jgi:hypothetical protein